MKIKDGALLFESSENLAISLLDTGYLKPEDYLEGDDLAKVLYAKVVIKEFFQLLEENEIVEYF